MEQITQNEKKGKIFLLHTLEGVTLGISAAVAGLSAGTIAVAEKCYDTLVDSLADRRKHFKTSLFTLLPFLLGGILGAILAVFGIKYGYDAAPFTITGLFGGFVLGSLPVALSELKKGRTGKEKAIHLLSFLLCLLLTAGLGIITALTKVDLAKYRTERVYWRYLLVFVSGFIAAGTCVIPGISGSRSLRVMGRYYPIINTVIGDSSILHSSDRTFVLTGILLLVILIIGALFGLVASSKFRKVRLSRHRVSTFYAILGLILGSLVSRFINSSIYPKYPTRKTYDIVLGIVLFFLGAAATLFLVLKLAKKKEEPTKVENKE